MTNLRPVGVLIFRPRYQNLIVHQVGLRTCEAVRIGKKEAWSSR